MSNKLTDWSRIYNPLLRCIAFIFAKISIQPGLWLASICHVTVQDSDTRGTIRTSPILTIDYKRCRVTGPYTVHIHSRAVFYFYKIKLFHILLKLRQARTGASSRARGRNDAIKSQFVNQSDPMRATPQLRGPSRTWLQTWWRPKMADDLFKTENSKRGSRVVPPIITDFTVKCLISRL